MFVMPRLLFAGGGVDGEAGACDNHDSAAAAVNDSNSCQGTEEIRPGPVKLRRLGRRLFHQSKVKTKDRKETGHKEACSYVVNGFLFYRI
jgi:hypothetical protein